MFDVSLDEKPTAFVARLNRQTRERVFKKLVTVQNSPFTHFKRLKGRNDYSLRVGKFRVIADIDRKTKMVSVTLIGLRKNVYSK